MSRPKTITEVLKELDLIIDDCIANNKALGLFAYVYRRTTAEIASEINKGSFEDNARLERFDVEFANLYIDAYYDYKNKLPVSKVWEYAFNLQNESLAIIQHILLGMNAHINLDLSIATATVMKNDNILDIEADFNKVNDILFQITNELQDRISGVSPLFFLIDWLGENNDEKLIDFSMRKARGQAWNSANLFWSLGSLQNREAIRQLDSIILKLSQQIRAPKLKILKYTLRFIQKFESKQVGKILSKLKDN